MGTLVYGLCSVVSLVLACLLLRAYWRKKTRFLLWASLCFAGVALNNALLFVDFCVIAHIDFSGWRAAVMLTSVSCLLFGMIWDGV